MIERLLTARELADVLGVSPATVLDWHEAGLLPSFRLNGRSVRFRESEVAEWIESQRCNQGARSASPGGAGSNHSSARAAEGVL